MKLHILQHPTREGQSSTSPRMVAEASQMGEKKQAPSRRCRRGENSTKQKKERGGFLLLVGGAALCPSARCVVVLCPSLCGLELPSPSHLSGVVRFHFQEEHLLSHLDIFHHVNDLKLIEQHTLHLSKAGGGKEHHPN